MARPGVRAVHQEGHPLGGHAAGAHREYVRDGDRHCPRRRGREPPPRARRLGVTDRALQFVARRGVTGSPRRWQRWPRRPSAWDQRWQSRPSRPSAWERPTEPGVGRCCGAPLAVRAGGRARRPGQGRGAMASLHRGMACPAGRRPACRTSLSQVARQDQRLGLMVRPSRRTLASFRPGCSQEPSEPNRILPRSAQATASSSTSKRRTPAVSV